MSLPRDPEEFDKDERISFSRLDNKYIATQDNGEEFEFDPGQKRWIPTIDEALIQQQQAGYVIPNVDTDSTGPHGQKRKADYADDGEESRQGRTSRVNKKKKQTTAQRQPPRNRAVYVTGIPPDVTVDEVTGLFSRKCGVIAEEVESGRPRVKLYTDAQGNFKGDALIVFFKPESVDMAIMLLDDTEFRIGPTGLGSGKMRVQAAEMSYKKTRLDEDVQDAGNKNSGSATVAADGKKPGPKRNDQEKMRVIKKAQKMSAKLADWSDEEDDPRTAMLARPRGGKWDKVVILRHMFTLEELDEDPAALLDIKEDIREECEKLGSVTSVVLYDKEEEGIVSVRFKSKEAADACLRLMHGRAFAGRVVEAFYATGKEKFQKSSKADDKDGSDEEQVCN